VDALEAALLVVVVLDRDRRVDEALAFNNGPADVRLS
jgi:hypothetical protein